jgi:hypothetical protein
MTTEEKLKDFILVRYHSIREFTIAIDIPYTTLDSIFRRGIGNSGVNNVIKICKALGISTDALADGEIIPINYNNVESKKTDVLEILDDVKDILTDSDNLTLAGAPINKAGIDSIIDTLEIGIEMAKKKAQQKP